MKTSLQESQMFATGSSHERGTLCAGARVRGGGSCGCTVNLWCVPFHGPLPLLYITTRHKVSKKSASWDWNRLDGTFGTDSPIEPLTCDTDCACQWIKVSLQLHTEDVGYDGQG